MAVAHDTEDDGEGGESESEEAGLRPQSPQGPRAAERIPLADQYEAPPLADLSASDPVNVSPEHFTAWVSKERRRIAALRGRPNSIGIRLERGRNAGAPWGTQGTELERAREAMMARVRTDVRETVRAALVLEAFGYGGGEVTERNGWAATRAGNESQMRAIAIAEMRADDETKDRERTRSGRAALAKRASVLREVVSLGMSAPPTPPSPETDAWRHFRREHDGANALAALCGGLAPPPPAFDDSAMSDADKDARDEYAGMVASDIALRDALWPLFCLFSELRARNGGAIESVDIEREAGGSPSERYDRRPPVLALGMDRAELPRFAVAAESFCWLELKHHEAGLIRHDASLLLGVDYTLDFTVTDGSLLTFDDVWEWYRAAHRHAAHYLAEHKPSQWRAKLGLWRAQWRAGRGAKFSFTEESVAREMHRIEARYRARAIARGSFQGVARLCDAPLPKSDEDAGLHGGVFD